MLPKYNKEPRAYETLNPGLTRTWMPESTVFLPIKTVLIKQSSKIPKGLAYAGLIKGIRGPHLSRLPYVDIFLAPIDVAL